MLSFDETYTANEKTGEDGLGVTYLAITAAALQKLMLICE